MLAPVRVSLALLLLAGCGRPATVQECNEILTRVATLEYQASSPHKGPIDPERLETIRARLRDTMMKNCVGRRITPKALGCVRAAKSATEIQEECFD